MSVGCEPSHKLWDSRPRQPEMTERTDTMKTYILRDPKTVEPQKPAPCWHRTTTILAQCSARAPSVAVTASLATVSVLQSRTSGVSRQLYCLNVLDPRERPSPQFPMVWPKRFDPANVAEDLWLEGSFCGPHDATDPSHKRIQGPAAIAKAVPTTKRGPKISEQNATTTGPSLAGLSSTQFFVEA